MKFNYLAVIVPRKWLPKNTEQARAQAWAAVTQLLLPDLGRFYSRFYPSNQPWGQDVSAPYSVVLGREDPVAFLNVLYQAKQRRDDAVAFHSAGMLSNINFDQTERIRDILVCHVTADGSNKALEAHSAWHLAMMGGVFMPDCGLYYLEQKCSVLNPELEKAVAVHPQDYALCTVTLEMETTA
ncbi:hypothetical protein D1646_17340 [Pseudoflavonifractor sp. 60]|uniref:hypothetical protein n=1 Tax=Pseudoflavonifractor sp. 60 TaxID=2304576 RepID=UPI0013719DFA|nr:hypothetical protein [Pseudoflavonifractor sp. 60]NBI68519.1 hypothetical protein [Pseudoflavonifractor sp. 60]